MQYFESLEILNPRKSWVLSELDSLIKDWSEWYEETKSIPEHDYDPNIQTVMWMDGEENIRKHQRLVQKTVTFLSNNFKNYTFMWRSRNGQLYEQHDCRIQVNAKHRLQELEVIRDSGSYALVPDSYWKQKGVQVIDKLADKTPDVAAEILGQYLKNPFGN
ncbi:hypothetical protein LQK59_003222 [Vibrio vulnificus]|nr:hypothetical protein [Vibrio vulnificus]